MRLARNVSLLALLSVLVLGTTSLGAEGAGQPDLDKATELQISAKNLADLEQVARLCDSALKKGLDDGNLKFAEQMLSSTLFQHASRLCAPIFDQTPADRRWPLLRKVALDDLERAVKVDPNLGEAHLLIARLHTLPGGERERAAKAAGAAVQLFEGDPKQQAAALVIRAQVREEMGDRLKDYERALELDPGNVEAWQARALTYAENGDLDKAVEDFNRLLKDHEDNVAAHLALGEVLTNLKKYDEALKHIEQGIQLKPESSFGYTLRAKLRVAQEDLKAALADLDQALKVEPRDLHALMIRARLHQEDGDLAAAKDDVDRILIISPDLPLGVIMRSMLAAADGKLVDAIADIESVLEKDPTNVAFRLQLANYYIQDKRPTKAIDIFTKILEEDESHAFARQLRADSFLSLGKHAEAIADFEIALKAKPEDDSVLNNFAWVLATSPDDKLRDGKRAVTLGTKACEVTEYKKAHIVSTLAAAYAETGDFESAKKWSKTAVELGGKDDEVDEQLKKELESYEQKKAWREKQEVKEKEDPVQPPRSQFET
ncbi:MAG: tetratricopeptide repeat protein [Planctomycetota bacterium]|nr:tetratricopeptide repeat protein [Planctomycetota bacterium]